MFKIKDITSYLNQYAPPAYQESYDNAGLIVGNPEEEVKGIMINLDVTEAVVEEAIQKGCNLIVAHHPIIFKGLKQLTGKNYVERTVLKAIKNDVAIYAAHTNLDNVHNGVSKRICDKIGLQNTKTLSPKTHQLAKLSVFVPNENAKELLQALNNAGAGQIGNYENCSFQSEGTGTFQPNAAANPSIGSAGELEHVAETKIEVLLPTYAKNSVLKAMNEAHPYEEVAYFMHLLENEHQQVGSGMYGKLASPMNEAEFLAHLKESMQLPLIRHTPLLNKPIETVAVCGGSGSFLIKQAANVGADIYITGDVKYHEFFDAEEKLIIADIGHYESEIFTNDLFYEILKENFANIALHLGETVTNPINYY